MATSGLQTKSRPLVTSASAEAKRARLLWPERHLEHCRHGRRQWHLEQIPSEDFQNIFPTLRQLHPREFDLVSAGFGVSYPETHRRVVNVTESMGRAKENPRVLTPGTRHYLTDKCRLVTGLESYSATGLALWQSNGFSSGALLRRVIVRTVRECVPRVGCGGLILREPACSCGVR